MLFSVIIFSRNEENYFSFNENVDRCDFPTETLLAEVYMNMKADELVNDGG